MVVGGVWIVSPMEIPRNVQIMGVPKHDALLSKEAQAKVKAKKPAPETCFTLA
jgi:hypothetical protein